MPPTPTPKIEQAPPPEVKIESPPPQQEAPAEGALNNELDDLLSKAFPEQSDPPAKEVEVNVKEDKKPEPPPAKEKPKTEQAKEKLPDPDSIDDKIIGKSQQSKDAWQALRNNYRTASNLVKEREEEIGKLKTALAEKADQGSKEVENLKNEIKELSKYRTMVDIQADPEFVSKYDQPIEKAKGAVKEMLKGMNVSDEVLNQIDFSNTKLMDQVIGHVGEHQDKIVARRLQRKVEEIVDLMDKRDETLSEQKTNYEEFMASKKKESSMKGAEDEGRAMKHRQALSQQKDEQGVPRIPFLTKKVASEGAAEPEIAQVEQFNKMVDLMNQKVDMAINPQTPEDRAEVAIAAATSHYLNAQLKAAMGRIKSLEQEIGKISKVSSDSIETKPKGSPRNGNGTVVELDEALSTHFSR